MVLTPEYDTSDLPCGFGTCDRSRLEKRIRELEARGNALCPHCNQPHFTLLADKACLLCDEKDRADKAETVVGDAVRRWCKDRRE